jgi:hypothetical protein
MGGRTPVLFSGLTRGRMRGGRGSGHQETLARRGFAARPSPRPSPRSERGGAPFLPTAWGGGPAEARRAKAGGGAAAVRPRMATRSAATPPAAAPHRPGAAHRPTSPTSLGKKGGGRPPCPRPEGGNPDTDFLPPLRGGSGFAKGKTEGGQWVGAGASNPRRRPAAGSSPARGGGNHSCLSAPLCARRILLVPHHHSRPGLVGRGWWGSGACP